LSPRERSNLPVPASIRQRLLNHAWEHREEFQLVLTWYAIERLLYRLSRSPHANTFVLKGALLFAIWSRESHRATRDLDLLGTGDPRVSTMEEIFREVCRVPCEDGLELDPPSVRGEEIRGADEYDGVRIRLDTRLAGARARLQVDIGFGDAVVPAPEPLEYPTLLDLPAPRLHAYPREVVVAEKFQALVTLGMANTRMKDFYDPAESPLALTPVFHGDAAKQTQWRTFLRRGAVVETAELGPVLELIHSFLMPPARAARAGAGLQSRWPRGSPWPRG
jgi:hypothetical protein